MGLVEGSRSGGGLEVVVQGWWRSRGGWGSRGGGI